MKTFAVAAVEAQRRLLIRRSRPRCNRADCPRHGPSRNGPACYIVKDASGFALANVYYEEELGR